MSELVGTYKRLKNMVGDIINKESDCRIEESDNGEIVIYTGLVRTGKKYRLAKPEEQMDFVPEKEIEELEKKGIV
jgi:hypothetical protein